MKIKYQFALIGFAFSVNVMSHAQSSAPNSLDEQLFNYYCAYEGQESQEQIFSRDIKTVQRTSGFYFQTANQSNSQHLQANIEVFNFDTSSPCVDYLLSVGKSTDGFPLTEARVSFDFDSSELTARSRYVLQQLELSLSEKNRPLQIEGNTDEKGSDGYNYSLGLQRAISVEQQLHLKESESVTVSYGEQRPINKQDSGITHSAIKTNRINRRVDIY